MPGNKKRKISSRKTVSVKKRRDLLLFGVFFVFCLSVLLGFFFREVVGRSLWSFVSRNIDFEPGKRLIDDDSKLYEDKLLKERYNNMDSAKPNAEPATKDEYDVGDREYLNKIINEQ